MSEILTRGERDEARLLAGEASDFEKELLGSWGAEQPSEAARASVLAMVGLAAGAGAGTTAAAGAGTAASVAPKAGAAALAKWVIVGAIGLGTVGAALVYGEHVRHSARDAVVAPPPRAVAPLANVTTSPVAPPAALPNAAPTTLAPPPRAVPAPSPRPHSADEALGEQVSALDRARRALANGDPAGTLRQLDDYEARFPRGALVEEAEVLRVESLLAASDPAAATRAGARFLSAHPGSPHAARVRALLGQTRTP